MKRTWKAEEEAKILRLKHSAHEVADFFLAPQTRPDLMLEILLAGRRNRERRSPAPPQKGASSFRLAMRTLVFFSVIAILSCAVGHHNAAPVAVEKESVREEAPPSTLSQDGGEVEPLDTVLLASYQAAWKMMLGRTLPDPLAGSFTGRLVRGEWAGLFLLDPDGGIKAVARPENYEAVKDWLERFHSLEKENAILRETMEALTAVQDAEKIYLEINLSGNRLFVKMGTQILYDFPVVTGKGFTPRESGIVRRFQTPRGILRVIEKQVDPVWIPPAWHWTERGLQPPAYRAPIRGVLGKYRLLFPDAIGIHGTASGRITPGKYSHGCIRMNAKDLKIVFDLADVGTELYIY